MRCGRAGSTSRSSLSWTTHNIRGQVFQIQKSRLIDNDFRILSKLWSHRFRALESCICLKAGPNSVLVKVAQVGVGREGLGQLLGAGGSDVVVAEGQKTSRRVLTLNASAYCPPLAFSMSLPPPERSKVLGISTSLAQTMPVSGLSQKS